LASPKFGSKRNAAKTAQAKGFKIFEVMIKVSKVRTHVTQ
jgi:hypothetical protein